MSGLQNRNHLATASSPYLLQHRNNPVHWMEWGSEALALARTQDKPILLSIGYAACHWCHVMAHESFEDEQTAALMNQLFVNIKVDREERPEIDQIYMEALHRMGQQGGWPLTMFLIPDARPYWGGTYFPKENRHGLPAFRAVLTAVERAWRNEKDKVESNAGLIDDSIRQSLAGGSAPAAFDVTDFERFASESISLCDGEYGGTRQGQKFPNGPLWETLLSATSLFPERSKFARQHQLWLKSLCLGGIYDHLGGGIHRYTVDAKWLVPHFEKMLYDNALFLRALSFSLSVGTNVEQELFRNRIEGTIAFLQREMLLPDGGLASSLDADSEGQEGKFYIWEVREISELLSAEDATLFHQVYDVSDFGNWEGKVILHRLHQNGAVRSADEETRLTAARDTLMAERVKRIPPDRDDKILTDWNGLAIRAIADCAFRLSRPDWLAFAEAIFHFISESESSEGRLPHAQRAAVKRYPALLTDLAAMTNAALSLYAMTGRDLYATKARDWIASAQQWHGDGNGGFFLTARDACDVPLQTYQDRDEATPSASGQWLEALQRAALLFDDPELQEVTDRYANVLWGRVRHQPHGYAAIMNALAFTLEPKKLVLSSSTGELADVARSLPDPFRIDCIRVTSTADNEKPAAYLCNGFVCLPPVSDAASLSALLTPNESG